MARWLFKTEPEDYTWDRLIEDGRAVWDGVRNRQAANNMRAMRLGEEAFFYRSVRVPAVLGVMRIVREAYPVPGEEDGPFVWVEVEPVRALPRAVPLKAIKAEVDLADLALVRQPRLSVMPVGETHWRSICRLAGLPEA